jgi:cysteine-rich repeat protein
MSKERPDSQDVTAVQILSRAFRFALAVLLFVVAGAVGALPISPAETFAATCGNGVVDKLEQCDDGNLENGDGCSSLCQKEGDNFQVMVYRATDPPPTPSVEELPLLVQISQQGVTWTFAHPQRVGRFVNGDYYVVGEATIVDIRPLSTEANGLHGSMLNIQPNIQRSGFDRRLEAGRYDSSLRVYPPITLTPGNKLVSSRSAGDTYPPCVMRPIDTSVSPVASVSVLTSVESPQPLDAFRPSYAQGSTKTYFSRNLRRELLPGLPPVQNVPPLSEFEAYLKRPWMDSVFFNFDVPAEYMASYGRENAYLISFAALLLTLDFSPEQKEPLLVYLTQYGIDLYGLVEQGHTGWQAHGGHGSGRKLPILLAGVMLNEEGMKSVQARFGEDMQTIWVEETPPAGAYTKSWHTEPETVVYGGHVGIHGESVNPGWGPYEHLPPSAWKSTLGESYRRCCTSVSWVGEALAARIIPEMKQAWNHPQFFAYVDRWMFSPDDPRDLERIQDATGMTIDPDFRQGQSWKILSGGGYDEPHRTFIDEMWAAYRSSLPDVSPPSRPTGLHATVVSSSQINLFWTPSTDNVAVAGYRIYRNGRWIDTTPETSYSSVELQPFKTYTYRVAACDAAENRSSKSNEVTKTTQPSPSKKFLTGDRAQVIEAANVRSEPSGSGVSLGIQSEGSFGTVVGGPWYWNSRWWWQIDFDNSELDGWVVQRKLKKHT